MRESPIENHLTRLVKKAGGRCYKWVSPGNKGVPDRIVFLRGMVFLVETKSPVGRLSAIQKAQHRELAKLGFDVVVLNSKESVNIWVSAQRMALVEEELNEVARSFNDALIAPLDVYS